MASGLVALLDDIAGIAKIAAASLDDVAGAAGKASSKAAGVVIDDTAVTPRYVVGFTPDRELPIIWRIALGSVRNKLLILLPVALLLSAFAPWAITPLLMAGGAFLCFEGAEKLVETVAGHDAGDDEAAAPTDATALEQQKISGAIRTDLILSAEIMAIALASVSNEPLLTQGFVLAAVGILVTVGVYGVVALIVKMDDIGLHLAKSGNGAVKAIGAGLVKAMPRLLAVLSVVGTAAMIWVGGGIIVHGIEEYGLTTVPHLIHDASEHVAHAVPFASGLFGWLVQAAGSGVVGLAVGLVIVGVLRLIPKHRAKAAG